MLIDSTLGLFSPVLGEGNTPCAILFPSAILRVVHAFVLRGVKEAAFVNTIVTLAKIVPIVVFIGTLVFVFEFGDFVDKFWRIGAYGFGEVFDRVQSTMLVIVLVCIGIEGAAVYSRYAGTREPVGIATVIGFLGVVALVILATLLAYGLLDRSALAGMQQPSMAGGLEDALLSAIIFAPGTILYIVTRLERGERMFESFAWILFAAVISGAVIGVYGLWTGIIVI